MACCKLGKRRGIACTTVWLIISALCLLFSLLLYFLLPRFMMSYINQHLVIVPDNAAYVQLRNPILPLYKDIYFFNMTNTREFSEGKEFPKLVECGPYSFREIRRKYFDESSLNFDKSTLTYTQQKSFHFNAETSGKGLHEDDTICTINVAMVALVAGVMNLSGVERDGAIAVAEYIFYKTKAKNYICQPAASLVFNYTDPLVQELHTNELLKLVGMNLPVNYVSMQWNASVNDLKPSIINTGAKNLDEIGQFEMWDGQRHLDIWFDKYANMINGTEGMLFKPHLQEGEEVVAFVDDAFRSIALGYVGKQELKGFHTYRYQIAPGVLDSAFNNPANARWGSWCPDGLFYLGAIQKPGVPVFASKPRFLDADPTETSDKFNLLNPNRTEHDTYALVHPLLGLTLQFQRSLQLNLQINETILFPQFKLFKGTTYYPVFYVKEHADLNEDVKQYILDQGIAEYRLAQILWKVVFGVLLFICLVGVIIAVLCVYKLLRKQKGKREEYIAINDDAYN